MNEGPCSGEISELRSILTRAFERVAAANLSQRERYVRIRRTGKQSRLFSPVVCTQRISKFPFIGGSGEASPR
jgi:hypothetical protein